MSDLSPTQRLQELIESLQPLLPPGQEVTQERLPELWQQANAALENNDNDLALEAWSELVAARPDEAAFHFGYALTLQQLKQFEFAGRHFSYAFALDPSDAASAYRLGECLAALGYTVEAHDALLAAQQLCDLPHNPPHVREMSLQLMQKLQ
jgi:tetratricopeptide (TPR) repeat protein